MTQRASLLKKVLLIAFGIILTLLILEIGLRVYLANFGREDQKILYLYDRQDLNRLATRHMGLPYLNYGLAPDHPEHNRLGFRGAEIEVPKPADTFRIIALGGSTTYGSGNPRWQDTYPSQLRDVLRDDYGYQEVDVVNAGVINYTSWETVGNLAFHIGDLEPDLVIIYHAMNDIQPRLIHPDDYVGLNMSRGIWQPDTEPVPVSALYRFVAQRFGWQVRYDSFGTQFKSVVEVTPCGALDEQNGVYYCSNFEMSIDKLLATNQPVYFERNIRSMIALAQTQSIPIMFASWAYSPLQYPEDVGGLYFTFEHNQKAVAEHNAITQHVTAEFDVPFYDFVADMLEDKQYWIDGMHVNTGGARLQAELFAGFIVEQELIP